jgi:hypothetical protein
MKKYLLILYGFLLFLFSCQPSVKEAIAYNEDIVSQHEEVDKKIAFLIDTYDNYVPAEMDSAYKAALKSAMDGITYASNLKPFHKDDTYRKSLLELFEVYKSVIEVEHARIIELLKLPPEQYQQKQIDEFDQLKDSADKKVLNKIEEVAVIQAEFAKKFNFTIEEVPE